MHSAAAIMASLSCSSGEGVSEVARSERRVGKTRRGEQRTGAKDIKRSTRHPASAPRRSAAGAEPASRRSTPCTIARAAPEWSKAVESAPVEAAGSSIRGGGRALRGPTSPRECRAAQSRQAGLDEAQEASWGTAKGPL
eukprot:scaffold92732_cov59-Phaeocystis_antarctica.AAC.1